MFANYFKTALRNILRHKVHALVNLLGFAAAMAAAIPVLLFVLDDFAFDTFHRHADRIFRVIRTYRTGESVLPVALSPEPLAVALKNDLPEVEDAVSINNFDEYQVRYAGRWVRDVRAICTYPAFLRIFSFEILSSSGRPLLEDPDSAVVTEDICRRLFAEEDPIGKIIFLPRIGEVRVDAVIENPRRTHIPFGVIVPMERYPAPGYVGSWKTSNFYVYVLLREGIDPGEFEGKHKRYLKKYDLTDLGVTQEISLQPLNRVYLQHSEFAYDLMRAPYDIRLDYLLLAVVLSILAVAVMNYVNIETARAARRAGEIALRKTLGASRGQLVAQFLCEAVLLSALAFLLALCVTEVILPAFNRWVEMEVKDLKLFSPENGRVIFAMAAAALLIGAAAGAYPAILLSAFRPAKVLKRATGAAAPGTLRKVLVVAQFWVSIVLITATLTIMQQLEYMRTARIGYNPVNLVCVPLSEAVSKRYDDFKALLVTHANIAHVTAARDMPVWEGPSTYLTDWEGRNEADSILVRYAAVDPDFIETMQIRLAEGRSFAGQSPLTGWIINREAAGRMGLAEPVGKMISIGEHKLPVIGVVEDYNFTNLRVKLEPLILLVADDQRRFAFIRISPADLEATLDFIGDAWRRFEPDIPFFHIALSERLEKMYAAEEKVSELFATASLLALLLSCLGLYGLTFYLCEQRTKEIAVRKANGASSRDILRLLLPAFIKPVLIANPVAWLAAYVALDSWLEDFAYRIDLTAGPFVTAAALSTLVVLLAVGFKTLLAASANPVDALRYE
jgi:putative ABC transport system permease protein